MAHDLALRFKNRAQVIPENLARIRELNRQGIIVHTLTNGDDGVVLKADALTGAEGGNWSTVFWLGSGQLYGHGYILQVDQHPEVGSAIRSILMQNPAPSLSPSASSPLEQWWQEQTQKIQRQIEQWWQEQTERLAHQFDEWWQEQSQNLQRRFEQWWQEQTERLARQFDEWFQKQLDQLCGTALGLLVLVGSTAIIAKPRQPRH